MEKITIELTNNKAYKLLKYLEEMKLIRVLKEPVSEDVSLKKGNSSKFRGSLHLSHDQYQDFQQYAKKIRNEWSGNI